jgi:hypothetical protein
MGILAIVWPGIVLVETEAAPHVHGHKVVSTANAVTATDTFMQEQQDQSLKRSHRSLPSFEL